MDELKTLYIDRQITLRGYLVMVIRLLGLESIDLRWLALEMDVPYGSLRDCVLAARRDKAIDIPTADPRTGNVRR